MNRMSEQNATVQQVNEILDSIEHHAREVAYHERKLRELRKDLQALVFPQENGYAF